MKDDTMLRASTSLEQVKGDIVSQTLDKLNSPAAGGRKKSRYSAQTAMSDSYDFNKSVLSSVYEGKGTIIDSSR